MNLKRVSDLRQLFTFLVAIFAVAPASYAINPDELLRIDDAFKISADAVSPNEVRVTWDIAEGYFLYRHRFNFKSEDPNVALGEPLIPQGEPKNDEFFGDVETYRQQVTVTVPVEFVGATQPKEITLIAGSQGCADLGVCYPPHKQTITITLPNTAVETNSNDPQQEPESDSETIAMEVEPVAKPGLFSRLGNSLRNKFGASDDNEFLTPEQAFIFTADVIDEHQIAVRWTIADGYYLYRDKFGFTLKQGDGVTLLAHQSPPGKIKEDESFGRMEVYFNKADIRLPLNRTSNAPQEILLEVRYQGCAERGFCYPPMKQNVPVRLPAVTTASVASTSQPTNDPAGYQSEQDQFASVLAGGVSFSTLAAFFGVGLLLAFTPCVFPMVPILSSIIIGQGSSLTTRRAFTLSLVYVLPMALTYTIAGVIAGKTGQNLQAMFQEPWLVATFAFVFVALALSMFGFYDLQLPNSWQSRLSKYSNQQKGGSYIGVGIMGLLSALIVGPCVAAPLAGALIFISQTGDAVLGGLALFAMSLGMGVPLLIVGTSAGKLLPRAGGWMNTVKAVFGVMLLGLAIWMLERILPAPITLALWGTLAVVSGVFLGALRRLDLDASGWRQFWQGIGLVSLLYGALLIIGATSGGKDVFQPLKGVFAAGPTGASQHELALKRVKGWSGVEAELLAAAAQNKTVMLDFYADWCVSCKEMEKYTFADAGVQNALNGVVLLQADVTANDDDDQALLKHFNVFGPPAILFFDANGREQRQFRVIGFMKATQFEQTVRAALG